MSRLPCESASLARCVEILERDGYAEDAHHLRQVIEGSRHARQKDAHIRMARGRVDYLEGLDQHGEFKWKELLYAAMRRHGFDPDNPKEFDFWVKYIIGDNYEPIRPYVRELRRQRRNSSS